MRLFEFRMRLPDFHGKRSAAGCSCKFVWAGRPLYRGGMSHPWRALSAPWRYTARPAGPQTNSTETSWCLQTKAVRCCYAAVLCRRRSCFESL